MARTSSAQGQLIAPYTPALCLDYANTMAWRGSTSVESLHNLNDVIAWMASAGALAPRRDVELQAWARRYPREAATIFAEAMALRECIFRFFCDLAAGGQGSDNNLATITEALRRTPARLGIARAPGGSFAWRTVSEDLSAAALLTPVLWSAGDLLAGPWLKRLRHCANEKCLWLFLDETKSGNRRWCSMMACGNRAKVQRHYLRHKTV